LPLAGDPPLVPAGPTDPVTISCFELEVTQVEFGTAAIPQSEGRLATMALMGRVLSNPVTSPFGELAGGLATLSFGYSIASRQTGEAEFGLIAVSCAGSHVTMAPAGQGTLWVRR
jgi:hypothetical protein